MIYYIDGYNLLFLYYDEERETLEEARQKMLEEFASYQEEVSLPLVIVFDAHLQENRLSEFDYKGLEIIYTSFHQTTDDYLLEKVSLSPSPGEITVVTNDKKLGRGILSLKGKHKYFSDFFSFRDKKKWKKDLEKPDESLRDFEVSRYYPIFLKEEEN